MTNPPSVTTETVTALVAQFKAFSRGTISSVTREFYENTAATLAALVKERDELVKKLSLKPVLTAKEHMEIIDNDPDDPGFSE